MSRQRKSARKLPVKVPEPSEIRDDEINKANNMQKTLAATASFDRIGSCGIQLDQSMLACASVWLTQKQSAIPQHCRGVLKSQCRAQARSVEHPMRAAL